VQRKLGNLQNNTRFIFENRFKNSVVFPSDAGSKCLYSSAEDSIVNTGVLRAVVCIYLVF
jgi:hypothetical protein